ncbi:MAG: glutamate racemase [Firmicutes bacterium]|nr:glutamate racemase [Bacillota bacterium]
MPNEQPIGVFDSGVGGLTVARVLIEKLPEEEILYFGDTANVPYGDKSPEQIVEYGNRISRFLVDQGVKLIIAACNTSSAISLEAIRKSFPVPVVGVIVPGARRAVKATRSRRVGVLATEAAARSGAFPRTIKQLDPGVEVITQGCPRLVPLVEAGELEGPKARRICGEYLQPLREGAVDTIILGCTHYPFLLPVLKDITDPGVRYIDPAAETVDEVIDLLKTRDQLSRERERPARHRFCASGPGDSFLVSGRVMVGDLITSVEQVRL